MVSLDQPKLGSSPCCFRSVSGRAVHAQEASLLSLLSRSAVVSRRDHHGPGLGTKKKLEACEGMTVR